ncbi:MAG TPA: PEGA domain-containing protein, partial [Thermoanaerobaculia bacterium]|nr:PEGA domain-containing protein [Thermoanaerobaculia bacterium]
PNPSRSQGNDQWRGNRIQRVQATTRLHLTVEPADAAVYVDNRFVGTAEEVNALDRGITVAPGHHVVTVSRPGFHEKALEVTVEEGKTGTLEISLNK